MFAAPPDIATEVFSAMPERYRLRGRVPEWVRVLRRSQPIESFLEGPSFDRAGNLYVTDIPYGRIFRIDPRGEWDLVAEYEGEPNGLKLDREGRVWVADHMHGILRLDARTGRMETVCDRPVLERFRGVNDLVFASNGDLYFTDQGQSGLEDPAGRIYCLRAGGKLDVVMRNIPSPNGIVLDAQEHSLFVAVTRANAVWRLPLLDDGTPSRVGVFLQLSGGLGPDGLAMDEAGNLAVCHPGLGSVWLFSAMGEPMARVRSCADSYTTNSAYGGPDNRWLYVTESHSGTVLRARMPVAGRAMYSHAPA
ncbi:SMP-30/gluconolactonase/LRE family protein [Ramlibacter sp. PS3R-8]|uniref:SMP-30/gluconolactonase/LRE family protein n=1 Tax=Ramlibacter sp. PS3R-8 TaxID=3133437 RepID=UPI00309E756D